MANEPDHVGRIIEQWSVERPELDTAPMGVIGRLHRVGDAVRERLIEVYAEFGLSEGEFDLLAALRRSGSPYELSPSELAASTMVTSGAITKRVDRLEARGLVVRRKQEHDGRARTIFLRRPGRKLIDRAVEAHYANEKRLIEGLPDIDRARLARILQAWSELLDLD